MPAATKRESGQPRFASFRFLELLARSSIFDLFTGIGKPEPLRYGPSGYWARGITGEHRRIYRVAGKPAVLTIVQCRYHYGRE